MPSAGLLFVDVTSPGTAWPEPALGFIGRCGTPRADRELLVLDRSAMHLTLAVDSPGSYLFQVASVDRSRALLDVKLGSSFATGAVARGALDKNGEDEEILEIEIDPLSAPCGAFDKNGEDEEILEIEIDPLSAPCVAPDIGVGRPLYAMLGDLCGAGEVDDHGDSFPCATFLAPNRRVAGEIANGWGDDGDVFQLFLGGSGQSDMWSVEISAAGEVETFGVLYDRSGRRLEKAGAGGETGFRIARTLPSGSYFVRVEGRHGGEGPYTLAVAASPW